MTQVRTLASSSPRGSRPVSTVELYLVWAAFVRSSALEGGSVAPTRLDIYKGELRPTTRPPKRPFDRPVCHLPRSFLALVARPGRRPPSNLEPRSRRRTNFYEHRRCHARRGTSEYTPHTPLYRPPTHTSRSCTSAARRTRHWSRRRCILWALRAAALLPLLVQVGSVPPGAARGRVGSQHTRPQLVPRLVRNRAFYQTVPNVARHRPRPPHRSSQHTILVKIRRVSTLAPVTRVIP